MKLLLTMILITGITTTFAAESVTDPVTDQPPVDHSTIFLHSDKTETPDLESMNQAEVVSVLNTRGYTYIEVNKDDVLTWLAVPTTDVKTGDTVHYTDGPAVKNHHSRTLDKSFDSVIFLLNVVVNGKK